MEEELKIKLIAESSDFKKKAESSISKVVKKIDDAMNDVDSGSSSGGGLQGMLTSMNEANNAIKGVIKNFAIFATVAALVMKVVEGTDTANHIAEQFSETLDTLKDIAAPVIASIGDVVDVILPTINLALEALRPVLETIGQMLTGTARVLEFISPLLELVALLFNILGETLKTFVEIIRQVIKIITFGLIDIGTESSSTTGKQASSDKGLSTDLDRFYTASGSVDEKLTKAADSLNDVATNMGQGADFSLLSGSLFDELIGAAINAWDFIKQLASAFWTGLVGVAGLIWEEIKKAGVAIWAFIQAAGEAIWKAIQIAGEAIWKFIREAGEKIWTFIKDAGIAIWRGIKTAAIAIWDGIKTAAIAIWDGIKTAAIAIFNFLGDLLGNMFGKSFSGGVGEGGFHNLGNRWSDGYQAGDIIGSTVDVFAGLIGKGWLWKKGGTLPLFAGGGNVGAQIWGMSEKGNPEFIFNSGGYNSVINAPILAEAVANGVAKALSAQGTKELRVRMDSNGTNLERAIADAILPRLQMTMRGGSQLL